jgi:hypothetical protein
MTHRKGKGKGRDATTGQGWWRHEASVREICYLR